MDFKVKLIRDDNDRDAAVNAQRFSMANDTTFDMDYRKVRARGDDALEVLAEIPEVEVSPSGEVSIGGKIFPRNQLDSRLFFSPVTQTLFPIGN